MRTRRKPAIVILIALITVFSLFLSPSYSFAAGSYSCDNDAYDAVKKGDIITLKNILNEKKMYDTVCDINDPYSTNLPLVTVAAIHGRTEIMKLLIDRGAKVNTIFKGLVTSTLMWAVKEAQAGSVKVLLYTGVSLDVKDYDGRTPLHYATIEGNAEIVKLLVDAGADKEATVDNSYPEYYGGFSALMIAAKNGDAKIVKILAAGGADLDQYIDMEGQNVLNGYSALQFAVESGNAEIVKLLINAGADVNLKPHYHYHERAILMSVLDIKDADKRIEIAKLLIDSGVDVDTISKRGFQSNKATLLFFAADAGDHELGKLLIKSGAAMNTLGSRYKRTPLMQAAGNGHLEIVNLLIDSGANVGKLTKSDKEELFPWQTAFRLAAEKKQYEALLPLAKTGKVWGIVDLIYAIYHMQFMATLIILLVTVIKYSLIALLIIFIKNPCRAIEKGKALLSKRASG